jgi:Icc protein
VSPLPLKSSPQRPLKLAQITDTHLLADPEALLRGCAPLKNLKTILDRLSQESIDALLLTGDLAEAGEPEAYQHLLTLLKPLPFPIYWLTGNHDCLQNAQRILSPHYPGTTDTVRSISLGAWQLILINSVLPTAQWGEGYVSETTLQILETTLQTQGDRPTIIALHHHPLPVGIDWLDQIAIINGADFLDRIEPFSNVKVILFGHIHWAFEQQHRGQTFYGCPASSVQVMPPPPLPPEQSPGFRVLSLEDKGNHQTQIHRL